MMITRYYIQIFPSCDDSHVSEFVISVLCHFLIGFSEFLLSDTGDPREPESLMT